MLDDKWHCCTCSAHIFTKGSYFNYSIYFFSTVNVGLAVGLSIGLTLFCVLFVIPFCIGVILCRKRKRNRPRANPATGATVTSNQETSMNNSAQPQYKNTEFSSQDTPPSYDAAIIMAFTTQQLVHVMQWWCTVTWNACYVVYILMYKLVI